MIPKIRIYITFLFFCCFTFSCTKDFEEINNDPNRPKEIYPGVMLGQLQYKMVNTSMRGARSFTHEVMQVSAPRRSLNEGLHRYHLTPEEGDALWRNFYTNMTDVEDLLSISEKLNDNNYKAIALIYKSWAYSILTDCFGDIPFSEATKANGGVLKPAFDPQKEIYARIFQDLETANELIDAGQKLAYGGDMVYLADQPGGMLKWKKFCNSLRLRLLLRVIGRDGEINVTEQINAILGNPAQFPVFTETEDDAIFRYPGTFPYFNPYYNARTLDWREGTYFTEYFIDNLNATGDPRLGAWATQVIVEGEKVYRGIRSGYESEVEYVVNENSSYHDRLKNLPGLGIMMTYAELEFLKAELALKGFSTGATPKEHYEKGIEASMDQWGVDMPAGFSEQEGIAFNASLSPEKQLEQIMNQKYFALFFNDYQSWFEKRRTGYPALPRGTGIPAGKEFPSRILYPVYLQSLNPEKLSAAVQAMGGDNSNVKVWWDK